MKQMKFTIDIEKHKEFKAICKRRKVPYAVVFRNYINKVLEYEKSKED